MRKEFGSKLRTSISRIFDFSVRTQSYETTVLLNLHHPLLFVGDIMALTKNIKTGYWAVYKMTVLSRVAQLNFDEL